MTILEKAAIEIEKIRPDMAPGDIKNCGEELGITKDNVSLYMRGKGRNPETAVKIVTYLRKVVNERKKSIA